MPKAVSGDGAGENRLGVGLRGNGNRGVAAAGLGNSFKRLCSVGKQCTGFVVDRAVWSRKVFSSYRGRESTNCQSCEHVLVRRTGYQCALK